VNIRIHNRLRFCVDECGRFERLDAVIRSEVVLFARVFAVKKRRVDRGVTARLVQLCLSTQQHSPECCLDSIKPLD
jgi:hypothetical protein